LSLAIAHVVNEGLILRPSFVFALAALVLVAIAETGRIPVDNPATHLELTMIHEAMILEYSGRHLALIEWASQLKLMLYAVLIANIFFPWGIADTFAAQALGYGLLAIISKLAVLAIFLAIAETLVAKMRLFRVQEYLGFAYLLGLLGMLSHIILEAAR
jgi:formate hydrogenlyase subunit 4